MQLNRHITFLGIYFFLVTASFAKTELIIEPRAGRAPILSFINQAKCSLDVVMYGLTDKELIDSLIKAKKSGKKVNILLEPEPYRASHENTFAITRLQNAQINVGTPNPYYKLTHQKTVLIDQQQAMIMTFNFTYSAFKKQRNFALIIDDPAMIQEINSVFSADWKHQPITVHHPDLVWSPDNSRDKILTLLKTAKHDIKIYAQDLKDYQIIGALAAIASKGVSVQILTMDKSKKRNKKFEFLRRAGVRICTDTQLMTHAKVIIIDQKKAMLGSINLTTPSINKNRELAVMTSDPRIVELLVKTFHSDWNKKKLPSFFIPKKARIHFYWQNIFS